MTSDSNKEINHKNHDIVKSRNDRLWTLDEISKKYYSNRRDMYYRLYFRKGIERPVPVYVIQRVKYFRLDDVLELLFND